MSQLIPPTETSPPQVPPRCPACGSHNLVIGSLLCSDEDTKMTGSFHPAGLKFFAFIRSVPLSKKDGFRACADCGCVWNYLDPIQLQKPLKKKATGPSVMAEELSHKGKIQLWILLIILVVMVIVGLRDL